MSRLTTIVRTVAGFAALCAATSASAQQTVLRYTTGAPQRTPWVTQAERLSADIEEASKGTLKIDRFIAAQLGNEQDTIQQVTRGRIDMGGFSTTGASLILPELSLLNMPFYFKSPAEQDCALDGTLTSEIKTRLAAKGLRFLYWTAVGEAYIIGKKFYFLPTEARGLKAAASQNKMSNVMWQSLGANPNPLGITELAGAFQTGLVDLQSQVPSFYIPSGLNKIAPAMTRINLSETPGLILINQAIYDKLPAEQRAAFDQAVAKQDANKSRAEVRGFEKVLVDMHVKGGGQYAEASVEQRDAWRKALEPVWPRMVEEHGDTGKSFFALMEKGRAACAK